MFKRSKVTEKRPKERFITWPALFISAIFLVMLLVTLLPQHGAAEGDGGPTAEVTIICGNSRDYLTESVINNGYFEGNENSEEFAFKIKIGLSNDAEWSGDLTIKDEDNNDRINKEKIGLLLESITAKNNPSQWAGVTGRVSSELENIDTIVIDTINRTLTITVPAMDEGVDEDDKYTITENEEVTVAIPPALLENWMSPVNKVENSPFIIYANPRAFIEGSIITATSDEIRKGGETIKIRLLNAEWKGNEEGGGNGINTTSGLNNLLGQLKAGTENEEWEKVITAAKNQPNIVLDNKDLSLLEIILPPVPGYSISKPQTTEFNINDFYKNGDGEKLIKVTSNEVVDDEVFIDAFNGDIFADAEHTSFTITPAYSIAKIKATGTEGNTPLTESSINGGEEGKAAGTITITLSEGGWADDLSTNKTKQKTFIDAFEAKTETEQWEKVKAAWETEIEGGEEGVDDVFTIGSEDTGGTENLKITVPAIPKEESYFLTQDQEITLNIPPQMLANSGTEIDPLQFTVKATPKAILTGSEFTEFDIASGGKEFKITLVNAAWNPEVATNNKSRNDLIDLLAAGDGEDGDKVMWNGSSEQPSTPSAIPVIKAKGKVTVTDKVLTITLPPVPGFDIGDEIGVKLLSINKEGEVAEEEKIPASLLFEPDSDFIPASGKVAITPCINQAAALSGSIFPAVTDFDLARGGKTIVVTLENDTWKDNGGFNSTTLLNGLKSGDTAEGADGSKWNSFINPNNEDVPTATIIKTSPQEAIITLPEKPGFKLANDLTVQLDINPDLLSTANKNITAAPSFKITAVKAELSGTVLQPLDAADIKKGGKTIIITLKNATWKTGGDFNEKLLKAFKVENSGPWEKVISALEDNPKNIKNTKNTVTIKLPPVPEYELSENENSETITIKIPYSLINEAPSEAPSGETELSLEVTEKIKVGQVGSATISQNPTLKEAAVINGGAAFAITLENAEWLKDLPNNTKAKNALIKGFTVQDQKNEWKLVSTALTKDMKLVFTKENEETDYTKLSIILPPAPGYAIVRDQVVQITIPKTALQNGKNDIEVSDKLTIKVPEVGKDPESFAETLGKPDGLQGYIDNLENVRIIVPPKVVQTITVNTIVIPGQDLDNSFTTIEVLTTEENVNTVKISATGADGAIIKEETKVGTNHFIFVFQNLAPNDEIKIGVYDKDGKLLQPEISKKITKGNKTYNELPKKDYSGSYSFYRLLTDKSLFNEILKYYSVHELGIVEP